MGVMLFGWLENIYISILFTRCQLAMIFHVIFLFIETCIHLLNTFIIVWFFQILKKGSYVMNQWNMRHVTHHDIAIDIILTMNIVWNKTWFEAQKWFINVMMLMMVLVKNKVSYHLCTRFLMPFCMDFEILDAFYDAMVCDKYFLQGN